MGRRAIIIGAGPAGLTAALELLRRTDVRPVVLEAGDTVGGLSRTVHYKGNRMDIGGHRFFSKSDRVMQWWLDLMPPAAEAAVSERGPRAHVPVSTDDNAREPDADGAARAHPVAPATQFRRPHTPAMQPGTPGSPAVERTRPREAEDRSVRTAVIHTETVEEDFAGDAVDDVRATTTDATAEPVDPDLVMLIRPRKSRIYFMRRFFDYPIRLTLRTVLALGPVRSLRIAGSYLRSRVRRIVPEVSLEDFLINRFGRELYLTFFKSYTEKVWGMPCDRISAEWGAQRIRGLSLTTAVRHFVRRTVRRGRDRTGGRETEQVQPDVHLAQGVTDTSLIERFLYPKFGPGQLWERVAFLVRGRGGELHTGWMVDRIHRDAERIVAVEAVHASGVRERFEGDLFFSTMPLRDLVQALEPAAPAAIREVSDGLQYRDFITVGLLVNRLRVTERGGDLLRDTWIYVQEPDVKLGRLQIYNNWSPHLVADPDKVWLGLEYFCQESDELWQKSDDELTRFAVAELARIDVLDPAEVCDAHVVRVPKSYPGYFGTYDRFDELRRYLEGFDNLFPLGRNGMHKYNNQDHSMLTAMTAVDGVVAGAIDRQALWRINTEQEYHEERT